MDTISKLQNIAKNNGGIITTSKAIEAGISRALLWKLNNENKIQRIARGQYIFEDDIRVLLNKLRKLNGIVSVHLIETDKSERIASFRVVYRKDEFPAGLSRKIK